MKLIYLFLVHILEIYIRSAALIIICQHLYQMSNGLLLRVQDHEVNYLTYRLLQVLFPLPFIRTVTIVELTHTFNAIDKIIVCKVFQMWPGHVSLHDTPNTLKKNVCLMELKHCLINDLR